MLTYSQTPDDIYKKIQVSKSLISEGKKDEFIQAMDDAIQSSSKIGYSYGVAYGYYAKANVAYFKRDFNNSIKFAQLADEQNLSKEDSRLKTDIYHLLGQNHAVIGLNEEAIRYYKKMIAASENIPDKTKSIYNENIGYNDLASIYGLNKKNKDSAYYYMSKIYNSLHNYGNRDDKLNILLAKATGAMAAIDLEKGKKDSSDFYLKKSSQEFPKKIADTFKGPAVYKHLAAVQASHSSYKEAAKYIDLYINTAEKTGNLQDINDAYKLKYEISEKISGGKKSYQDLKKYVKVNDSIEEMDRANIKKVFVNKLEEKNKQIQKESMYSRYFLMTIILIVLAVCFGGYMLKQYLKRKNLEKKGMLYEKESEITELESKINIAFEDVISLAKSNSPNFLTRFQEVYPDFCNKIIEIYPEIQNSELISCAYIRLNFSTKDIANFTFVTPKTVQMKKYRLRKKLNISSDKDIYIWMNNL